MNKLAYLSLDVHKNSTSFAVLPHHGKEIVESKKIKPDISAVKRIAKRFSQKYNLIIIYEAGCCGFGLYRALIKAGYHCEVIAPSSLPKSNKKVKTDKIDAKKLAFAYRAGLLSPVRVPDEDLEEDRDLVRYRLIQVRNRTKTKQRIRSFLLRKGIKCDWPNDWSKKFFTWLSALDFSRLKDRLTLDRYLTELNHQNILIAELESEIYELSRSDRYREQCDILCAFRGIETTLAMVILTHIADFRAFHKPAHLTSFIGIVPGENSSGDSRKRLPITRTGSNILRWAFISATQQFTKAAKTGPNLLRKRSCLDAGLRSIVEAADRRCFKKMNKLIYGKKKHVNKAKVAVAREMTGFIWEAMMYFHHGEFLETA